MCGGRSGVRCAMRRLRWPTARPSRPGDLVASDLIYPNRSGETYSVKYNPNHRWYYIPEMRTDEALLLKCYDSATDGRTRFGPHTAFIDPTTPADAAPRESIELQDIGVPPELIAATGGFAFPPYW